MKNFTLERMPCMFARSNRLHVNSQGIEDWNEAVTHLPLFKLAESLFPSLSRLASTVLCSDASWLRTPKSFCMQNWSKMSDFGIIIAHRLIPPTHASFSYASKRPLVQPIQPLLLPNPPSHPHHLINGLAFIFLFHQQQRARRNARVLDRFAATMHAPKA